MSHSDDEDFYPRFGTFVSNSYSRARSNPNFLFDSLYEFNYGKSGYASRMTPNHSNLYRPVSSMSLPIDLRTASEHEEYAERLKSTDHGLFTITYSGNCAVNNYTPVSKENSASCNNISKLKLSDSGIKFTVLPNGKFKTKRAVLQQPSIASDNIKSRVSSRERLNQTNERGSSTPKLLSYKNRSIYLPPYSSNRDRGNLFFSYYMLLIVIS
jgi:hypothetical protein